MRRHLLFFACIATAVLTGSSLLAAGDETSCILCHSDSDMFDPVAIEIVQDFAVGAHARTGLSCHDCHGGRAEVEFAEDMDAAMDPDFEVNPYLGAPEAADIPALCGRCHSNPNFMKRFKPDARVDQEAEYWTSQHGMLLKQGDERVATCVSCHGVHGILSPSDSGSMVYPTRVAETCRACHGDADRMAGSTLEDGRPLPIDQFARWRQSVHAKAMYEKEDLTAPTCNDCHGNHGAVPPGLDSVNFVCGQCHGREAELFRNSPKHDAFQLHNEFLEEAGGEGCPACHEDPEPQAKLTDLGSFGECTACHGNHGIIRPTIAMLAPPPTPCALCHFSPENKEFLVEEPAKIRRNVESVRTALLERAAVSGLEGEDLFNWLVDQASTLPNHAFGSSEETGEIILRPEFARLWKKFRVGKTTYSYEDPVTGEPVEGRIIRCDSCHGQEPLLADEPIGFNASVEIMNQMHELTAKTAKAERTLLQARRGGVETRDALLAIDQAIDSQIALEVLVHSFTFGPGSEFETEQIDGVGFATEGLEAGQRALDELAFRRRGLIVSLVFITLVLIALALKIRQISAR